MVGRNYAELIRKIIKPKKHSREAPLDQSPVAKKQKTSDDKKPPFLEKVMLSKDLKDLDKQLAFIRNTKSKISDDTIEDILKYCINDIAENTPQQIDQKNALLDAFIEHRMPQLNEIIIEETYSGEACTIPEAIFAAFINYPGHLERCVKLTEEGHINADIFNEYNPPSNNENEIEYKNTIKGYVRFAQSNKIMQNDALRPKLKDIFDRYISEIDRLISSFYNQNLSDETTDAIFLFGDLETGIVEFNKRKPANEDAITISPEITQNVMNISNYTLETTKEIFN